jgi:hypothetical protein
MKKRRKMMQKTLAALGLAAGMGLLLCQGAGAVPASTAAVNATTAGASSLQLAQYAEHPTRRGIVKCYRDFVVGPYRCHYFRYW